MKKLLFCALVSFALFQSSISYGNTWDTAGVLTNPAINTILADTGPQLAGGKCWRIWVNSTISSVIVVEHRDAANATNLHAQTFPIAGSALNPTITLVPIETLADNERLRLRLNAAITGVIQGSIFSEC